MRQIGSLPESEDPQVFADYLLSRGVTSRTVRAPDGWAIWVHNEDLVPQARADLEAYREDPHDPRFRDQARAAAEEVRREEDRRDREYRKNVKDVAAGWHGLRFRRRPLTVSLVAACVAVYLAEQSSPTARVWITDKLLFASIRTIVLQPDLAHGLEDILRRGEVWRLVTPIFLHGNLLHLLFNAWAMLIEGTVIERLRGTAALFALVLLSAVVSNLGQYLYAYQFHGGFVPWVGISGVAYALFGYLWMKSMNEPEQGIRLDPTSVRVMLLWLLLGFTPFSPVRMANGAHVGGLLVGVLYGLARF